MPANISEFMSEYLHYNLHIVRDRGAVFVKEWVDAKIIKENQLMDGQGLLFFTFIQFRMKFPMI